MVTQYLNHLIDFNSIAKNFMKTENEQNQVSKKGGWNAAIFIICKQSNTQFKY